LVYKLVQVSVFNFNLPSAKKVIEASQAAQCILAETFIPWLTHVFLDFYIFLIFDLTVVTPASASVLAYLAISLTSSITLCKNLFYFYSSSVKDLSRVSISLSTSADNYKNSVPFSYRSTKELREVSTYLSAAPRSLVKFLILSLVAF